MQIQDRSRTGLSAQEVLESRRRHGENQLTPPRRRSLWHLYLEKYEDPIIRILLVAAVFSLGLAFFNGEFVETIGIILAVLFATTVGFYFERDAARKFDVLNALGEEQPVKVLRDGHIQLVSRREVVVGDVVIIETGDEVPADGILFEGNGLQVDESSLTGEPIAEKSAEDASSSDTGDTSGSTVAYPVNQLLRSSLVMQGAGRMVVTAVGDKTEIGLVAREATELSSIKTPLNMQLDRLANLISKIGSAVSVLAFLSFLVHDILTNPLWHTTDYVSMLEVVLHYFMMAVTLIVMAVPEGLPMAVTLALALNMRRMLKSNNLVRKLQASETMGAVTVICTDKTGTLTENRMTVVEYQGTDRQIAEAIALNTTADLDGERGIGNPTEVALLRWMKSKGTDTGLIRSHALVRDRLPFSTETKYMATIAEHDGREYLYVKGAPEIVMSFCRMPDSQRHDMTDLLLGYQQRAMRTLAFAMRQVDTRQSIENLLKADSLQLQGIVAISDPVRSDVPQAVEACQRAGIEVKIVTGDTEATALEIARQIGLTDGDAITGDRFASLSDEQALEMVSTLRVMSRARPANKQRLVELLQRRGEVVAVTGDGTNDAPALNHAHVGLSLGSGTSVAKNASDITIIDDSFRSVVRAVEWGRSLYKNIQRFIFFQLVVNVTALLLVLGGSVIGTEMPLTVTQILWVNLIMDTFAAMALASLPPSHEVMNHPPRSQHDFIISPQMAHGIVFWGLTFFLITFVYLYWLENNNVGDGVNIHELTKFFTVFVMLQWWNLFNARSLGSSHSAFRHFFWCKGFVFVLLLILLGQWLIVEYGGNMFRTEPLNAKEWGMIIACTSPVILIGEAYRLFVRLSKR
jgi:Ca2+-transporting ATPase